MKVAAVVLLSVMASAAVAQSRPAGEEGFNAFFALETATKDDRHQTPEAQAAMLKELGYAGWAAAAEQVSAKLAAVDRHGLKMIALWAGLNIDPDQPAYDAKLKDTIASLKERDTILWVFVLSKEHKPSTTGGDERAVSVLREVADRAHDAGIRVSIYPHVGFYAARVEDAVRLAQKANRRNLGVTFNLCHWLSLDHGEGMKPLLRLAMPYLQLVTINGADYEGGWDRLIQPLGQGAFDVCGFLRELWQLGYRGPIGFQGYGIKGDLHQVLTESIAVWRQYCQRCR